jgi:hypothetical protein
VAGSLLEGRSPYRRRAVLLLGVAAVLGLLSTAAQAKTLAVPGEYFTIQEALDAAQPGDRVEVAPGTYRQSLTLKAGVELVGTAGADSTRIIPPPDTAILIRADSLASKAVFRGFEVDGGENLRRGIVVTASEIEIVDCYFHDMNTAITLDHCPSALVARNRIHNLRAVGVMVQSCSPRIVRNEFRENSQYAIALFGPETNPIIGGSRGRANRFSSYKGSMDVGNGTPNTIDARYNDWGPATTVEMNAKGYPANITVIEDKFEGPEVGMVDYRHWVGQPLMASLLSEPGRLVLPGLLALAVLVGAVVRIARLRRRPAG